MQNDITYLIALTMLPGIGLITAKKLIAYIGNPKEIYNENNSSLKKIPGISSKQIAILQDKTYLDKAERELEFIIKHKLEAIPYYSDKYPSRLKQCDDAPLILFKRGSNNLKGDKIVSIVGTRNASAYGKDMCKELVKGLKVHNAVIVSGLAYGIDYYAHNYALDNDMETIAVVGHSLDKVYPADHKLLARTIEKKGALITEFNSTAPLDKYNFVTRNRIIAGIADATIVIESAKKGGALITAEHANHYNRDVFAIPGKKTDYYSQGCNKLIKQNKAHLLEDISDLEYILDWLPENKQIPKQKELFIELSEEEQELIKHLKGKEPQSIDILCLKSKFPIYKVSSLLLNLEFSGLIKMHPGKLCEYCGK